MAHDIEQIDGKDAMVYFGESPWHRLGTAMTPAMTIDLDAAMRAAQLDLRVDFEPLYLQDSDGTFTRAQGQGALRREDGKVLGYATERYEAIQNTEAFRILRPAIEQFGVTIETGGWLNAGRCWMLAKLPKAAEVVPGDKVDGYMLLVNAFNGLNSFRTQLTGTRVVCKNTLNLALNEKDAGHITLNHTRTDAVRLDEVEKLVTRFSKALKHAEGQFKKLASHKMTLNEMYAFIDVVLGLEEVEEDDVKGVAAIKRETMRDLAVAGTGADFAPNTAWAALNAVTEYVDHYRTTRIAPDDAMELIVAKQRTLSQKDHAALFGDTAKLKVKALQTALTLV